ncbi:MULTISPECIES: alpha/beta fold hydrolase [Actinomadura]|uniref:Pimeloyl-ACP methyl ester carboxylesterase n=1 Tax=Actinomadura madurae TaxID=1993 RepID=A0A1I5IUI8_9ACTN|nr:alpha/beta hydrolase [Actinomadura madurae]SFO64225.1 Pimeloyl-ACP methyl ester carboxylesterase [Actinomadura madurae]
MEKLIKANGVELCAETFGDAAGAPILLIGNTMLTWPDELCELLAELRRFVVRYDLRDTGGSAGGDPEAPGYTLRDLVDDAAGVLDAHDLPAAHVAGFGPGGWIAQLLALDHPGRVTTLTLVATRPTAPGPSDEDLPDHAPQMMAHFMKMTEVDWSDRESVVAFMVEGARHRAGPAFDEAEARSAIERIHDRTRTGADPGKAHRANQMGTVFAALDCGDRWRERLPGITAPTLVVHGEDDPFFPLGNGRALAAEIPDAELLVLPGTGSELPRRTWDTFVPALLRHTS